MAVTGTARDIHNLMRNIASFSDGQATVHDFECEGDDSEMTVRIIPNDGLYRGGIFDFRLDITPYPLEAPSVTCLTKIYHPNIDSDQTEGLNICLNLMDSEWTTDCTLEDVVQGILFLLYNPNLEDPLNSWFDSSDLSEEFAENVAKSLRGETVDDIEFEKNCCLEPESTLSTEELVAVIMEDILTSLTGLDLGKSIEKSCDVTEIIPLNSESTDTHKTETVLKADANVVSGETTLTNTQLTDTAELSTLNDVDNNLRKEENNETTTGQILKSTVPSEPEFVSLGEGTSVDDNKKMYENDCPLRHSRRSVTLLYSDSLAPGISLMSALLPKIVKYIFHSVFVRCQKSVSSS